ncbi:MAG: hypothetical protein KI785_03310 [Devosiaceae bacterium]|nr:hypothetical protein [Devosiaceae bacterium MH13]
MPRTISYENLKGRLVGWNLTKRHTFQSPLCSVLHLACLSWNVHRARGNDGIVDPKRTVDTLLTEVWRSKVQILCLQEADGEKPPYSGILDRGRIEAGTGLVSVHQQSNLRSHDDALGFLGMVVFVHPHVEVQDVRLVDMAGLYPRGAVIVDAGSDGFSFRLVATHLSLSQPLRVMQMRTIAQHLARFDARPTVLCGDLNEWRPWGGLAFSKAILGATFAGSRCATFPVSRPMLALDRFLVSAPGVIHHAEAVDSPAIRMTSDHRPLYAEITLKTEA